MDNIFTEDGKAKQSICDNQWEQVCEKALPMLKKHSKLLARKLEQDSDVDFSWLTPLEQAKLKAAYDIAQSQGEISDSARNFKSLRHQHEAPVVQEATAILREKWLEQNFSGRGYHDNVEELHFYHHQVQRTLREIDLLDGDVIDELDGDGYAQFLYDAHQYIQSGTWNRKQLKDILFKAAGEPDYDQPLESENNDDVKIGGRSVPPWLLAAHPGLAKYADPKPLLLTPEMRVKPLVLTPEMRIDQQEKDVVPIPAQCQRQVMPTPLQATVPVKKDLVSSVSPEPARRGWGTAITGLAAAAAVAVAMVFGSAKPAGENDVVPQAMDDFDTASDIADNDISLGDADEELTFNDGEVGLTHPTPPAPLGEGNILWAADEDIISDETAADDIHHAGPTLPDNGVVMSTRGVVANAAGIPAVIAAFYEGSYPNNNIPWQLDQMREHIASGNQALAENAGYHIAYDMETIHGADAASVVSAIMDWAVANPYDGSIAEAEAPAARRIWCSLKPF
jgi:hypothetical protein